MTPGKFSWQHGLPSADILFSARPESSSVVSMTSAEKSCPRAF
jgi:hypothetical protein